MEAGRSTFCLASVAFLLPRCKCGPEACFRFVFRIQPRRVAACFFYRVKLDAGNKKEKTLANLRLVRSELSIGSELESLDHSNLKPSQPSESSVYIQYVQNHRLYTSLQSSCVRTSPRMTVACGKCEYSGQLIPQPSLAGIIPFDSALLRTQLGSRNHRIRYTSIQ